MIEGKHHACAGQPRNRAQKKDDRHLVLVADVFVGGDLGADAAPSHTRRLLFSGHLALWHQNITVYEQFIKLGPSDSRQCVFFATRSMLSLYFATFACIGLIYGPEGERPASRAWLGMAFITAFVIGNQIFFDGFNDQSHGRYSAIAYRTYDSVNSLIWKSIIRMFLFCVLLAFWLRVALEWRRNRFKRGGSESQEAPPQQSDNATKLPFTHPLSSRPANS
ncbi:MAG: hypothetical protein AAAC49_07700 [Rhizobium leguminosarum]